MKKLVSVLLVMILALSAMVTASADGSYPVQEELLYQFEDRFVEQFSATYDQIESLYVYDELYYHLDENGQIDWCLISAKPNADLETADIKYLKFNDFVLHSNSTKSFFFDMMYGIYDVAADEFMSIVDCYNELDKFEGAVDVLRNVPQSRPIGDYDNDHRLSILDATGIQRMLAKLDDIRYDGYHDKIGNMGSFFDVDGDSDVSILDATAIQRKLALLDSEPVDKEPAINEEMIFSDYSQRLRDLPEGTVELTFNKEYSAMQFLSSVYNEDVIGTRNSVVVIKSNAQYKTLFNSKAPEFTDEFFESNWLVAAFIRTGCYEGIAPISKVAKDGDTLYVQATVYISAEGFVQPIDPFWLSIVSVDKELLKDIKTVVEVS